MYHEKYSTHISTNFVNHKLPTIHNNINATICSIFIINNVYIKIINFKNKTYFTLRERKRVPQMKPSIHVRKWKCNEEFFTAKNTN